MRKRRHTDTRTARARIAAHDAFDPLWKRKGWTRAYAYRWLAEQLGVPEQQAHMKGMDFDTCERVIAICAPMTLADEWEVLK